MRSRYKVFAVSKFIRAVSIEIMVKDSRRCNIAGKRKRSKTVNKRRGVNKTKELGVR